MNLNLESIRAEANQEQVISVSQLNKMAKSTLEAGLPVMWIKGEISGLKTYSHLYFDLKDEGAKISCVMFAKLAAMLDFNLANGTQVEVRGRVTIYPVNGSYQINVERVRQVGLGELWEAYHRLIIKLRAEGLFEAKFKQTIPVFPRAIGVITSKEGAVIRDVITTLRRRMPNIPVVVYHTAVQGVDASMQIVRAIRTANVRAEVDVLIICRGGGSMEDLWCFNEEAVAREVFASRLPVISAVGHETDTTIIDFVADLRAPTPTAAAELVAKSRQEWLHQLQRSEQFLKTWINQFLNERRQQVDLAQAHLKVLNPLQKLVTQMTQLQQLQRNLNQAIIKRVLHQQWQLELLNSKLAQLIPDLTSLKARPQQLQQRLAQSMLIYLQRCTHQVEQASTSLKLLNPAQVLERGFAIVKDQNGKVISSVNATRHHARIALAFHDGEVSAIIDKKLQPEQAELI